MSQLFGETLREAPAEADTPGYQWLLRAGYVRQLAAGIFSYLPLGWRTLRKIETIVREEMDAIGGQEIHMPVVQPAEIWKQTGRWYDVGDEMARFQDRNGRDLVLGMTHEEVVADLVRREVRSYRQLPMLVYQIQTKFRDEPRPRAGLIRTREFTMKDSYSLDVDTAGLEAQYERHYEAYHRIFRRIGLENVLAVRSDTGMMGGQMAHEFMFLNDLGEDTLALCDGCGASSNLQVARFRKPVPEPETMRPLEKVATPGASTITDLAAFLNVPAARTAKVVFFTAGVPVTGADQPGVFRETLVMALVRGDMDVNETKLANAVSARWMQPAEDVQITACAAVPGYASPVGMRRDGVLVVADDLAAASPNLVSGANETGYHLLNVNAGRDYEPDIVKDITSAFQGAPCSGCGAPLRLARGVEIGNIFQLGTRYSEALGAVFVDADGERRPVVMGSYGIGIGRALACAAETCRDEYGLALPAVIAPYDVSLVSLPDRSSHEPVETAEALYQELTGAGIEVLYDDRDVTAGVKFADADLIGMPWRITVSGRSLKAGGVEMKRRTESGKVIAARNAIRDTLAS